MQEINILTVILLLAAISFGTRAIPFILGNKLTKFKFMDTLKNYLPAVIMLLLTLFELHDLIDFTYPYGLPTLLAMAIMMAIHFYKRNVTITLILGLVCYFSFSYLAIQIHSIY